VTVYAPVCTCAVPGINGCAKHTYPTRTNDEAAQLAQQIVDGHAFCDSDAIRVAHAYLEATR
jgi:hypothetical protein